jgi:hypothetical protein
MKKFILKRKVKLIKVRVNSLNNLKRVNKLIIKFFWYSSYSNVLCKKKD